VVSEPDPEDDSGGDPLPDEPGSSRSRRRRSLLIGLVVVVLLGIGLGLGFALSGGDNPPPGPEGVAIQRVPDLASADTTQTGALVDGITCRGRMEASDKYHVHSHVSIYVKGRQMRIPAGAGIAAPRQAQQLANGFFVDNSFNGCLYWLHVHANDGIIHVEAPSRGNFTLGQFFDIWQQPLGPDQVGPASGVVAAFINGQRWTESPRDIPLLPHAVIQLDVGSPVVPFQPVQFNVTGLCGAGAAGCASSGG
jgi:hypothetical protein